MSNTKTEAMLTVTLPVQVSKQRLADLLCCALEGGSNYWYRIEKFGAPDAENLFHSMEDGTFRYLDYPLSEGGFIMVSDYNICDSKARAKRGWLRLAPFLHGFSPSFCTDFHSVIWAWLGDRGSST